ncbi:RibD family protein [Variovorax boronicumulans]|uniref:RibD family protein n=1 Tax=Variovorax boronicumulans TaxID=436515 RepID=UPI001C57C069
MGAAAGGRGGKTITGVHLLSALPVPSLPSAAPGDVAALWPLCLAIAERRRRGEAAPDGPAPLAWSDGHGYALQGDWDAPAQALFALLKPLLDRRGAHARWVIGQLGQSLDGCIATHNGDSCFVNGPEGLVHVHRLRALCDAVIVGAGTACLDNPQLTTRRVEGPHPTRVLIDPGLRVLADARVFTDAQAPTLLVCAPEHRARAEARLGTQQVIPVPRSAALDGQLPLADVVAALHARGLNLLFVEGGGVTVSQFVRQGCLDRLHLIVAPVMIGAGYPGLQVRRSNAMGEALRPAARTFALGGDLLWDLDLRAAAR